MPYTYDYPRPALTVDCAVFAVDGSCPPSAWTLEILLVRRDAPPFEGSWATPGGFVEIDEPIAEAAGRELQEETGLTSVSLEEFGVFGTPGRDPRGRIVAVAHRALIDRAEANVEAATDAREADWFALDELPELAFDHDELVAEARRTLQCQARCGPIGLDVLEEPFELDTWRHLCEVVLGEGVDAARFESIVKAEGLVERVDEGADGSPRYAFDEHRCRELQREPAGLFGRVDALSKD